ncbi:uncharacterized protein LOC144109460 isoform X2 [Amblyomma americanum]
MTPCKMRYTLGVLIALFIAPSFGWQGDRVRLRDVEVLTLRQGQYTTGRRSHPVPQLNCRGGSAGCRDAPSVVQCYNRGSDGRDVQWECKAEMKKTQKFGLLQVSCEGYDYPKDDYILVGSCGLEYYLEKTGYDHGPARNPPSDRRQRREIYPPKNARRVVHEEATPGQEYPPKNARRQAHEGARYRYPEHHHYQRSGGTIYLLLNVVFIAISAFVIYAFCLCCMALCQGGTGYSYQRLPAYGEGHQWQGTHFTTGPGFGQRDYCAPPPYNPTFTAHPYQYTSGCGSAPGFGWANSSGGGPGFWTGAASGGLMGYLFGSRNNTSERTVCSSPGEHAFLAASPPPSVFADELDEYVSTGFGGTDVR